MKAASLNALQVPVFSRLRTQNRKVGHAFVENALERARYSRLRTRFTMKFVTPPGLKLAATARGS